ncbi:unnamed protein product [Adineta steineri]|uniref:Uncharacterized protein n=1 Tax=Adineta steineri TaxID=433720 RepID=A0A818NZR0_9BILA|nr:unnamed protein product [Adineta steineri]CAF3615135.1 unnamed protein product [Adineta steineri]
MYRSRRPYGYRRRYPYLGQDRRQLPFKEIFWRLSWPYLYTLVLASLMILLTIIIFILEIINFLNNDRSNNLSNITIIGAKLSCSVFFLIPAVFMYLLVLVFDSSRIWSTYTLIANLIALISICILIVVDIYEMTPSDTITSTKIKILKSQLAAAILMFFFPFGFLTAYIYTVFITLFPLHSYTHLVYPTFSTLPMFATY